MARLAQQICLRFQEARKAKGLSQSALARLVGCQQSAVSMFEGGMSSKLSDETVKKIADLLGVALPPPEAAAGDGTLAADDATTPGGVSSGTAGVTVVRGYCPNGGCPSNVPYAVDGRLFYRPSRHVASPTGGHRCTQCGEILERACPVCGAPLNDGACCAVCGSPYVTPVLPEGVDAGAYARARREEIASLRALA